MFTGIIEELGTIKNISQKGNTLTLTIQSKKLLEDIKLGDSIAVNGVCLTVTDFSKNIFMADVMPETFKSTSLSILRQGSCVNLERAMAANGRFGGHFVTGHVDVTGNILRKTPMENAIYIEISVPKDFIHFILLKGSIALDGTSLTIFGVGEKSVTVSIIPHTSKESILGIKMPGDIVNIEFDMMAKYLYSFMNQKEKGNESKTSLSMDFLKENGFY